MLLGVSNGYRIRSDPSPFKNIFPLIWVSRWVLQGCPVHDSRSNYFGGRKRKEETLKTWIPQTDHHWQRKPAWQGAVIWSNEADVVMCQSFQTFGINLRFGGCQVFYFRLASQGLRRYCEKEGENQPNWALNISVDALKVLFSSLSIKRKQKSSACQSVRG